MFWAKKSLPSFEIFVVREKHKMVFKVVSDKSYNLTRMPLVDLFNEACKNEEEDKRYVQLSLDFAD